MSRITEKLSKIFTAQIPEFLRVGDTDSIVYVTGSTTAGSNVIVLSDTAYVSAGDKIVHSTISGTVFVTNVLSNTKIKVNTTLSTTVTRQNLKFVKTDTVSNFVKFLEAYFKFLEQDQHPQEILQNSRLYADSEKTIDSLIESFFKNYGNDIPRNIITDKRSFIKHFKDIHKTKGTEEAYKLLFRVMFNEDASFFYPDTVILKTSDGVWKKDFTIRVTNTNNINIFDFLNTKIIGKLSKATAIVNNVVKINTDYTGSIEIYELYLENIKGNFLIEDVTAVKIVDNVTRAKTTITATTIPQLTKIDIIDGGNGYTANSKLYIQSANVKISSINETGKIQSIKIINSGAYPVYGSIDGALPFGFVINVSADAPSKQLSGNILLTNTIGTFIGTSPHGLSRGKTANLSFYGNASSYLNNSQNTITVTTVLDENRFRFNILNPQATTLFANLSYSQTANLASNIGILRESEGYWLTNRGKLSELIYIQGPAPDSPDPNKIYYQQYSYVVRSGVSIDQWKDISQKLVHPAGMEAFGEIYTVSDITANVDTTVANEVWDYLGITCDMSNPPFDASMTTYSDHRVANLAIKTDHVYYIFNYL
jgi:hypothetical protein